MSSTPTSGTFDILIQMPQETGEAQTPDPANPQQENAPSENPAKGDMKKTVALAAAVDVVKTVGTQAVNAVVSNIGLATGNSYAQAQAQRAMQTTQAVVSLAVSAYVNPVAFAVTLAGMAISAGSEAYQREKQREIDNYTAAQHAKRLGYTTARR